MPPVTQQSRMPKGLTPEEKQEYQRERNRRKQANLRARRAARLKEDQDAAEQAALLASRHDSIDSSSAFTSTTTGGSSGLPSPSDTGCGRCMGPNERERGKVHFDALMRAHGHVAKLKETVGRLVQKLVDVGVDDISIENLLADREGSSGSGSTSGSWTDSPPDGYELLPICSLAQKEDLKQQQSFLDLLASASSSAPTLDLSSPLSVTVLDPSKSTLPVFKWDNDLLVSRLDRRNQSIAVPTYTSPNSDSSLYSPLTPPGDIDVESIRSALNLTHQPIPQPLSHPPSSSHLFAQASNSFFGGGGSFWNVPPPIPRQQSNLAVQTPEGSYLHTLFDLHDAYRASRRRMKADPSYCSSVSETAIKELQITILRTLFATSDQRDAYEKDYPGSSEPLSPEDQALYDSGEIDERCILMPSSKRLKVVMARNMHIFDLSYMMAEAINGGKVFGDVHDRTGWTMPKGFWEVYPTNAPLEIMRDCKEIDVATLPAGLRGSTIKEIILKTEEPGWRVAGPFPLAPPSDFPMSWE